MKILLPRCFNLLLSVHILLVGAVFLSGCQSEPGKPPSVGQYVFMDKCMGCHMGAGDPPGPNDVVTNSTKLMTLEAFRMYLRSPDNDRMPAILPDQLSDADLKQLYDYLIEVRQKNKR